MYFGTINTSFVKEAVNRKIKHDDIWYGDTSSIKNYIRSKVKMLRNDMLIKPTDEELDNLNSLKTMVAVDNAVHSIIDRHWREW